MHTLYPVYLISIVLVLSYLIGAVNSAMIISKLMKLPSPKSLGSGNPGATNMLRTGSKKAALFTLLGDILKGVITVGVVKYCGFSEIVQAWVLCLTIIGHIFPVYYKFKGGKGVATFLGTLLIFNPYTALVCLMIWTLMAVILKYSSLAAVTAVTCMPFIAVLINNMTFKSYIFIILCLTSLIILIRHRANIKRLITGQESRIRLKKQ